MPITFNGLHKMLKKRGTTLYKFREDKIIGGGTVDSLFGRGRGGISTRTIEILCRELKCQPGDLMEYVPDDDDTNAHSV